MRPLAEMPDAVARTIRVVLTDIDDTLTTDGRLPAHAYAALDALKETGFGVAAITGRPAGWCDMIARFWPVDGVVGENGAFYFSYDAAARSMTRRYAVAEADRRQAQEGLARIRDRVLAEVPGSAVASDQFARLSDLAIDFCEDVPPLPDADIARIKAIFEAEGAVAKISSIHVNGWFGAYDKLTMTRCFCADILDIDIDADPQAVVYCGDSPNDAPMFAHFPHGCGVANIRDFEDRMDALPGWIAPSRGGAGFVEIAQRLLETV
ncbi:MAG: HAD hydrolase family protein [Pseudomonadota bacterium]